MASSKASPAGLCEPRAAIDAVPGLWDLFFCLSYRRRVSPQKRLKVALQLLRAQVLRAHLESSQRMPKLSMQPQAMMDGFHP